MKIRRGTSDPEPIPQPPFDWNTVKFIRDFESAVRDWPETSVITEVVIELEDEHIRFPHTMAGRWPSWDDGEGTIAEGNVWAAVCIDGQWWLGTLEWLKVGQTRKRLTASGEWGIGAHAKREPMESWVPRPGENFGIMVSTRARDGNFMEPSERSQVFFTTWPVENH